DETIARLIESQTVEGEAAVDNQKQVRMHLVGAGCAFVKTEACIHLSRQVPITLCAASAKTMAAQDVDRLPERIALVPPQALMRILEQCDRHVVF
ncbi:MAG: hypothetical protein JRI93_16400, partial [Deltaproteobacteria bacterium]|nr:hypothetical protein [Deltaproteobacteria bacterium]